MTCRPNPLSAIANTLASNQSPVEPGRAMAADLLFEIEGGEGPDPEPVAALTEVIRLSAFNDVLGDLPMIGIDLDANLLHPIAAQKPPISSRPKSGPVSY